MLQQMAGYAWFGEDDSEPAPPQQQHAVVPPPSASEQTLSMSSATDPVFVPEQRQPAHRPDERKPVWISRGAHEPVALITGWGLLC